MARHFFPALLCYRRCIAGSLMYQKTPVMPTRPKGRVRQNERFARGLFFPRLYSNSSIVCLSILFLKNHDISCFAVLVVAVDIHVYCRIMVIFNQNLSSSVHHCHRSLVYLSYHLSAITATYRFALHMFSPLQLLLSRPAHAPRKEGQNCAIFRSLPNVPHQKRGIQQHCTKPLQRC